MRYRTLGDTGLKISEIGFGTAGTSGLMTIESPDEQFKVVKRAVELGINYFDTAPDYGDTLAEVNTGRILRELGIRPIITTKVEIRAENLNDIAGHIERSLDQSLIRLGVDYVDILQIHNGPISPAPDLQGSNYQRLHVDDYFAANGAIEGLERVRRQGKTRFIGFICRGTDGREVRRLLDTGLFHVINASFTLLNPSAGLPKPFGMHVDDDYEEVITYANSKGVGTVIYGALSYGLLTDRVVDRGEFHPLSRGLSERQRPSLEKAKALGFLSISGEHSLAQAAVRFILMTEGVSTVLGGFSDVQQLEELVAVSGAGGLSPELMTRIEMAWRSFV